MNWTKEEIIEYNLRCAEFLGYKYYPHNFEGRIPSGKAGWQTEKAHLKLGGYLCRHNRDLPFFNDWNRIMAVVNSICNKGFRKYSYSNEEHSRCVFTDMTILYQSHNFGGGNIIADSGKCSTEREAVVQAINNFFNLV